MDTGPITAWTLMEEIPVPSEVNRLLVEGEVAITAFKTFRDSAVVTNKRLIVSDAQGLTGNKLGTYSVPFRSVTMWSTEDAGPGVDADIDLWTRAGHIKLHVGKGGDIRRLDWLIARAVLPA